MFEFIADKSGKLTKITLNNVRDISYTNLMKLLRNKDVKVNGNRVSKDLLINEGDKVTLYYKAQELKKFHLIFKDDNILVVDKKSGYESVEVYNDLLKEYSSVKFIHRLDRNTDGLLIFALNDISEEELLKGFKNHSFDKKYHAVVYGKMSLKKEVLSAYLLKNSETATVKIFNKKVENSVMIKTGYEVLKENEKTSELLVTLYTGKTHQIRAHLAHVGHFIIGDNKYGDAKINKLFSAKSQMLSAYSLTLFFDDKSPLSYLNNKTFTIER